ncbi:MAG: endo-1,4-beta-xylanase, partial [Phycisphaerae bacterium]|nr:endo-1,4-beta-xylanase [Phycisphaerae bacterium]
MRGVLFTFGIIALSALSAQAEESKPLPEGGEAILTSENTGLFSMGGDGRFLKSSADQTERTKDYTKQVVRVNGMPFQKAFRIQTRDYRGEIYGVELASFLPKPVNKGDVLLITFYMRGIKTQHESGEVITTLRFQRHGAPWTGYMQIKCSLAAGTGWKKYQYPAVCGDDIAAGRSMITFHLGYANQIVDIGGVEVINFDKKVKPEDLPVTESTYPGREPDAPWRKAAAERIEKYRKGDLKVIVRDAAGNPVEDAAVKVDMRRHAFPFGTEVSGETFGELTSAGRSWTPREAEKYKAMIKKLFNTVTVAHFIEWRQWERPDVRHEKEAGLKIIHWANQNGLNVVGQALLWPKMHSMPDDIKHLTNRPEVIDKRIKDHMREKTTALRDKMYAWMVVNEPHCTYAYLLFDKLGG